MPEILLGSPKSSRRYSPAVLDGEARMGHNRLVITSIEIENFRGIADRSA